MLSHFNRMKGFCELMLMQQWSVTNKCGALRSNFAIVTLEKIEDDFLIAICVATEKRSKSVYSIPNSKKLILL